MGLDFALEGKGYRGDRREVTVMTETKVRVTEEETVEDACCEPECGPETCGPSAQVITVQGSKIDEHASEAADQCCDPECGPETCG